MTSQKCSDGLQIWSGVALDSNWTAHNAAAGLDEISRIFLLIFVFFHDFPLVSLVNLTKITQSDFSKVH